MNVCLNITRMFHTLLDSLLLPIKEILIDMKVEKYQRKCLVMYMKAR